MKPFIYTLLFLLSGFSSLAQSTPAEGQVIPASATSSTYINITIVVFIVAAILLLVVSLVLLHTFKTLSNEILQPRPIEQSSPQRLMEWDEWNEIQKAKPGVMNRILGLRPIEEEKDLLIEHEYDGITELDNPVPNWFNILFYGTIVFGFFYFITYHVAGWGKLQDQEYAAEVKRAKIEKAAYLAKSANNIDENSVKENADASVVSAGEAVFKTNCVACHGDKGQGVVGPNLTDEYWLHGGKINNIFKTVKYGIPEKGMISWEKTLSPKQISDVSNYILSLKGSNPPNPKAPQGEKEG